MKKLVTYFSASGVTKEIAENLSKVFDADIYEIKPKIKYTKEDLNWMDKNSRSSVEMRDKNSRPEIVDDGFSVSDYDIIFLGFPIWWYVAPTIVNTFLEHHDFSNKKIILFGTSGGSSFGKTLEKLKKSVSDSTEIREGGILNGSYSLKDLEKWMD